MFRSFQIALATLLATATLACGTEGGIFVTVDSTGVAPAPIAALLVEGTSVDDGWTESSTFPPADGDTEILLPATLGLRITGTRATLEGPVDVCVTAQAATGAPLGTDCETVTVTAGEVTNVTVVIAFGGGGDAGTDSGTDLGTDSGTDLGTDTGTDLGTDSGTDMGFDAGPLCGNGTIDPGEDCDGANLGGATCASLGFMWGTLACNPGCMYTGCSNVTVPVQRKPINASYIGNVHAAGTLRPTFDWEPSTGGAGITYELDYSTDAAFPGGMTTTVPTGFTDHQPASDLAVAMSAPVGARYYWRVRACEGTACSAYSPTWYFDLGRSDRDFNGDGYADAVIGAGAASEPTMSAGAFYIFSGGPSGAPDATPDAVVGGAATGDQFGVPAAPAGDVNGDGFADLIVGAENAGGMGMAYLFFGGSGAFDTTPDVTWAGGASGDDLGLAAAGAGDVNGDGFADLVIGADQAFVGDGYAHVYFGGASVDTTPEGVLSGSGAERFGFAVAGAGDVNGDGFGDIIVGARANASLGADAGAAYIFLGGAGTSFDAVDDGVLFGTAAADIFGISVDGAGDVNDDGGASQM